MTPIGACPYLCRPGCHRHRERASAQRIARRIERNVRIRPSTGTLVGRVALNRDTVQILDAWTDPLYEVKEDARVGGVHTMLGVPLLREGLPHPNFKDSVENRSLHAAYVSVWCAMVGLQHPPPEIERATHARSALTSKKAL
jgi:hypothetical protein